MSLTRKLAYLAEVEAVQWLPPRAVSELSLSRLRRMLAHAEQNVPLYRELYRKAGVRSADVVALADLAHFPTVTREQIVDAYPEGVLARRPRASDVVFRTSGTSGLFMEIAYDAAANDYLDAVYGRALFSTGYRPWHKIAYFWWEEQGKPLRSYERLGLMKKSYLSMAPDPRVQLEELRALHPDYIYNFPSAMMMIARMVEQEGLGSLSPRGIVCHGEFMPAPIQKEISRIFRCPVYNQYGAQEFNRMAWDCGAHGPLHVDADSVILEVLDGERPMPPGREGEVVVTGIANPLMPLIRYRIGDAGRLVAGRCPCGRGLPLMELTEGRMDDVLTLPGNRRVGPRTLAPRIEALHGFTQYRVVQKSTATVEVLVVWAPGKSEADEKMLGSTVRDVLGPDVAVTLRAVDSIPLNRRGKLRKVVSEVITSARS